MQVPFVLSVYAVMHTVAGARRPATHACAARALIRHTHAARTAAGARAGRHGVPRGAGIPSGQLHLDPSTLAGIYQCNITFWDDQAISALNPGLQLPHAAITPVTYNESVGVAQLFLQYVQLDGNWGLGTGTTFKAPACVQKAHLWNGVVALVTGTPNAIGRAPGRARGAAGASGAAGERRTQRTRGCRCGGVACTTLHTARQAAELL